MVDLCSALKSPEMPRLSTLGDRAWKPFPQRRHKVGGFAGAEGLPGRRKPESDMGGVLPLPCR